jgi:hypothetical protein
MNLPNQELRDHFISLAYIYNKASGFEGSYNPEKSLDFSGLPLENVSEVKELVDFLQDQEVMKIIMVFLIKGFTWERELRYHYNISAGDKKYFNNERIARILEKLVRVGFIQEVHYTALEDDVVQEYLQKSMLNFSKWLNAKGSVYIITPEFVIWGERVKDYITSLIFSKRGFYYSYKEVFKKTHQFIDTVQKIENEEQTRFTRQIKSPFEDVVITKPTKLQRETQKKIAEAVKELKHEEAYGQMFSQAQLGQSRHLLLTQQPDKGTSLMIQTTSDVSVYDPIVTGYNSTGRVQTTYNGYAVDSADDILRADEERQREIEQAETRKGKLSIDELWNYVEQEEDPMDFLASISGEDTQSQKLQEFRQQLRQFSDNDKESIYRQLLEQGADRYASVVREELHGMQNQQVGGDL